LTIRGKREKKNDERRERQIFSVFQSISALLWGESLGRKKEEKEESYDAIYAADGS
jgi:hypothetical protein